jgi:hypothetical protein
MRRGHSRSEAMRQGALTALQVCGLWPKATLAMQPELPYSVLDLVPYLESRGDMGSLAPATKTVLLFDFSFFFKVQGVAKFRDLPTLKLGGAKHKTKNKRQ